MLAIVGMWAAVLGPVWLRRHDAIYESRSVDKFSAAMRVLARRGPKPIGGVHSRAVLMPGRPDVASVSAVSVSGLGGDRPVTPQSAHITQLRRNLLFLAVFDLITIAIWAGVGSKAVLGAHVLGDLTTAVSFVGLNRALERERRRASLAARRRRVANVMASEQASVAETAPRRRNAAPVWHDPAATAAPRRVIQLIPVELESAQIVVEEPVAPRRKQRIPATSLREQSQMIDLTTPGAWREEVDLRDIDEEIRIAAMIGDDDGLHELVERRSRRVV